MKRSRLIDPVAARTSHRQMMVLLCVQIAVIGLLVLFVSSPQP